MERVKVKPLDFKTLIAVSLSLVAIYAAEFLPHWSHQAKTSLAIYHAHNSCSVDERMVLTPQISKIPDSENAADLTKK